MMPAFFDMMMFTLFAKFMLNDIPHALGLLSSSIPGWVPDAWDELVTAVSWSGGDLEERMSEAVAEGGLDQESIDRYKMLLGGYYLIAEGHASDDVVNDLYDFMKRGVQWGKNYVSEREGMSFDDALKFYRREYGVPEGRAPVLPSEDMGYLGVLEGIAYVDRLYIDGTRAQKAIAIDSTMYVIHTTEGILQFVTPLMWNEGIAFLIADVLTWLRYGKKGTAQ